MLIAMATGLERSQNTVAIYSTAILKINFGDYS